MKISEEQRAYIHDGLAKALKDIDAIKAHGPVGCLPEIEKLCREMLPVMDAINAVLEQTE